MMTFTVKIKCTTCGAVITFFDEAPPWTPSSRNQARREHNADQFIAVNKRVVRGPHGGLPAVPDGVALRRIRGHDDQFATIRTPVADRPAIDCPACHNDIFLDEIEVEPWPQ